jgi:hypothetical protein
MTTTDVYTQSFLFVLLIGFLLLAFNDKHNK